MTFLKISQDIPPVPVPAGEITARIAEVFGEGSVGRVADRKAGRDDRGWFTDLWLSVEKERFLEMIDLLGEFDFPHFHVISGNDDGEAVTLHYHLSLFRLAGRGERVGVTVSVPVYKTDLVMPSLFSRIPGVEYSEREIREMLGIDFDGLPNKALIFLPEDWDETIKPWRRDETGPGADDVRHLS
ncbi:hypothetical protein MASR1M66_11280 [Aminivibrio sp.]